MPMLISWIFVMYQRDKEIELVTKLIKTYRDKIYKLYVTPESEWEFERSTLGKSQHIYFEQMKRKVLRVLQRSNYIPFNVMDLIEDQFIYTENYQNNMKRFEELGGTDNEKANEYFLEFILPSSYRDFFWAMECSNLIWIKPHICSVDISSYKWLYLMKKNFKKEECELRATILHIYRMFEI